MTQTDEVIRHMNVCVEKDEDVWAVVVKIEGNPDARYPVESKEQGEELIKAVVPAIMPIILSAIERGEYVSLTANGNGK